MKDNKNRELAISATSKIFEKVNDALRKPDTDKRWFWELLQNAKDTVVFKKGETTLLNNPSKKINVRLILTKNEKDETILKFTHNGNPFKCSNHEYKYDDPKCLLLADSGKIEEDESQREDITGQFGTGFLSTHILSLRILVEGIFLDKEGRYNEFNFELDREFQNKLQLVGKVEKSLDQYDNNFSLINDISDFETKFTYFLDNNKEGINTVKSGIEGLENYIPFVLSFSKEIQSVEIFDDLLTNTYVVFSRPKELEKRNKEETVIKIKKTICPIVNKTLGTVTGDETIHISTISDLENHIDLATRIYPNSNGFELREIENKLSVLFCTFPLIGSEDWRFPLIFNSSKFYPETERNGITLIKDKDNGNKDKVRQAIEIYKMYCHTCINSSYRNLIFLADTRFEHCPKWCDEDWYVEQLNEIREFLLSQPIVTSELDNPIIFKDTLFPIFSDTEKLENYWNICYKYSPSIIPKYEDIEKWMKFIDVDFKKWDDLKFPLKKLLAEIEIFASVEKLAEIKFDSNKQVALDWLKVLYKFIQIEIEQKELFDEFAIIPNQKDNFKKLNDLRFDVDIPEELKNILVLFEQDKRGILINRNFTLFKEHIPLSVKDVSYIINEHINDKQKTETDNYKKGMFLMSSYFTSELSEKRNSIHSFSLDFFPTSTPSQKVILRNTSDFNWDNVNKWLIKSIINGIEKLEDISKLQEYFSQKNKDETIIWLNKFITFLNASSDYRDYLISNKITPNQYDEFCLVDDLHNDIDELPNKLKEILYSLSNKKEDWKAILVRNGIFIDLKKSKTLKDITDLIDDYVKENRENLDSQSIRNSILSLVKWVSDKKDELNIEDLFKWFYLNKANLVLNTLDSGNDRDNIFEIIQSGQSLETLSKIANSSLTNEQLNALVENTELLGQFISWLNTKQIDNPNEELGEIGEEFLFYHLCKLFGEENVEWSRQNEYDFTIFNSDKSVKFYVDAKTTASGISNSDNVPFFMRTSQWNFLPKEEVKNKYLIARVFKNSENFDVRFLNIKPEEIR